MLDSFLLQSVDIVQACDPHGRIHPLLANRSSSRDFPLQPASLQSPHAQLLRAHARHVRHPCACFLPSLPGASTYHQPGVQGAENQPDQKTSSPQAGQWVKLGFRGVAGAHLYKVCQKLKRMTQGAVQSFPGVCGWTCPCLHRGPASTNLCSQLCCCQRQ